MFCDGIERGIGSCAKDVQRGLSIGVAFGAMQGGRRGRRNHSRWLGRVFVVQQSGSISMVWGGGGEVGSGVDGGLWFMEKAGMRRVVDAPSPPSSPSFLFAVLAPFSAPAHPGAEAGGWPGRLALGWAAADLPRRVWHSDTSPKTAQGSMWLNSSMSCSATPLLMGPAPTNIWSSGRPSSQCERSKSDGRGF